MNIAQLSEQLKDVPQNRLIDYARNPNSVVPQFLALAEIQRRQHLGATPQPPAATVAEDVLAQAAPVAPQMAQQLPENMPGVAQLPTGMPQGMASGGIVAFADGGDIDDDEGYDPEEDRIRKDESRIMSLIAGLRARAGDAVAAVPKAVQAIKSVLPESYEAAKAKTEAGISSLERKGTHPYESVALDEAKKLGLDANLVRHVLQKETGNLKDPATARSKAGAYGPMQLMPGTAKELGVDITDPEQNTRGGVRYLAQMMSRFKDPTLALAAYNAGPGRVQQMLKRGHGIESLPQETQGYVKFSKGGVASYARGDLIEDDSYNPYAMLGDIGVTSPSYQSGLGIRQFLKRKLMGVQDVPPSFVPPSAEDFRKFDQAQALFEAEQKLNAPVAKPYAYAPQGGIGPTDYELNRFPEQAGPERPSFFQEAVARIAEDRQALKAQAEQDKYLALMQAGLGMMAGSSPYALQNIGAGGMQGISAYAAAKKQRAAEAAALGKEELAVKRLEQMSELEKASLEQTAEFKRAGLSQAEANAAERRIQSARDDIRLQEEVYRKRLDDKYPNRAFDPKEKAAYNEEMNALFRDPKYLAMRKIAFPNVDFDKIGAPATSTGEWSIKPKQ